MTHFKHVTQYDQCQKNFRSSFFCGQKFQFMFSLLKIQWLLISVELVIFLSLNLQCAKTYIFFLFKKNAYFFMFVLFLLSKKKDPQLMV